MEDGLLTGLTTDDEESIRTALQSSHPKSKIRQFLLKSLTYSLIKNLIYLLYGIFILIIQ